MVAGVLLVIGLWARTAALMCFGMNIMFIAAIVTALHRGLDISCGCFGGGADASKLSQATLWRDLLFLFWAGHATLYDRGVLGLDALLERRRQAAARPAATPKGAAP